MIAPKLRFKEFDEGWAKYKLGNEAQFFQGEQVSLDDQSKEYAHGLIKFLRIENFTQKSKDFRYIRYTGSLEKVLDEQDIAIVRYGATAGFICSGETGVIANNLFKVSVDNKKINQKYLELVLKSEKTFNYFQAEMSGGAMPALNFKIVGNLDITYSSIQEQTKIASFLCAVDEKISQLNQKHRLLCQYKQGMMQKLFSQQLRFKADDGSEFGEWDETTLGEIGIFLKGKGIPKADIVENGLTPCIRYGELYTHYGEVISKVISATNVEIQNLVLSKANDVLIPASGETQIDIATASCVLKGEIALSGDLNIFRTEENGIFLSYLIRSHLKMQIAQLAQGNSVVHLYSSQLKGVQLNLPCLEEQTKIANFLSAIDQKIEVVAEQIKQAKTWKKGLLQQMFV